MSFFALTLVGVAVAVVSFAALAIAGRMADHEVEDLEDEHEDHPGI